MLSRRPIQILHLLSKHVSTKKSSQLGKKKIAAHQRNIEDKLLFGGVLETKTVKKKRERLQKKSGLPIESVGAHAPDSEEYWLANISSKDLKVYRKCSSGRYKEVDKSKLGAALSTSEKKVSAIAVSSPSAIHMPEILVNKLTTIPMWAPKAEPEEEAASGSSVNRYPSVTRILSDTMSDSSKAALEKWKAKMITELGEEGFAIHNREQLSFGTRFHSCVRKFLETRETEVDEDMQGVWSSVERVLVDVREVELLEANVAHPVLKYKGIVDCVASFKNNPSVIEWKVSEKLKPYLSNTYDAPLQLSAYLGALSYDRNYRKRLKHGVVVVAYKDGSPAQVFPLDENLCTRHWNKWVQRVQLYWKTFSSQANTNYYVS